MEQSHTAPIRRRLYLYGADVHRMLWRAAVRFRGQCVTADGVRGGEIIPGCAVRQVGGTLVAHRAQQRDGLYALGYGQRVGGRWGASRVSNDPSLARGPVDGVAAEESYPLGRRGTGWRVEVPGKAFSPSLHYRCVSFVPKVLLFLLTMKHRSPCRRQIH